MSDALLTDAKIGPVLFWGPNEDGSQALIISEDPHECGWPERITYVDRDTLTIVRSGCAGCGAERPVPTSPDSGPVSGLSDTNSP